MLYLNDMIKGRAQELPFITRMLVPILLHFIDFYAALNVKDFLETSSDIAHGKIVLVTVSGVNVVRCLTTDKEKKTNGNLYRVSDSTGESLMTLSYIGYHDFIKEFDLKTYERFSKFFEKERRFHTLTFYFNPQSYFPDMLFARVHSRKNRSKQEAFILQPAVFGLG
jgi:hypothetical protein